MQVFPVPYQYGPSTYSSTSTPSAALTGSASTMVSRISVSPSGMASMSIGRPKILRITICAPSFDATMFCSLQYGLWIPWKAISPVVVTRNCGLHTHFSQPSLQLQDSIVSNASCIRSDTGRVSSVLVESGLRFAYTVVERLRANCPLCSRIIIENQP